MKGFVSFLAIVAVAFAACFACPGASFAQDDGPVFVNAIGTEGHGVGIVLTQEGWKNTETGKVYPREIYGFEVRDPADAAAYDRVALKHVAQQTGAVSDASSDVAYEAKFGLIWVNSYTVPCPLTPAEYAKRYEAWQKATSVESNLKRYMKQASVQKVTSITKTTTEIHSTGEQLLACSGRAGGRLLHMLFAPARRLHERRSCSSGACG